MELEAPAMGSKSKIYNGKLTITSPHTGDHRTFEIRTQKDDALFAPGRRILSLLTGPDNQVDYRGFAFVEPGGRVRVWRRYQGTGGQEERTVWERYAAMIERRAEYEARGCVYRESRACLRCNRELTDPLSIEIGEGPTCRVEA